MKKSNFSVTQFNTYKAVIWSLATFFITAACSENNKNDSENSDKSISVESAEIGHNALTEQEKKERWVLLFDGTTTENFRGYTKENFPETGWMVKDGVLMVEASGGEEEGFGGDIITKEQYKDFEFKTDFKISPEGNSGILYLVKEVEGVPAWHMAPEYQLLDDEHYEKTGEIPMDTHRTGDNYDMHASRVRAMKPVGEWNTAMIRVKDRKVEHWLNGQKTVEYELGSPEWEELYKKSKFSEYADYGRVEKGHIGIQDHGHQLWYRNIKVRPL